MEVLVSRKREGLSGRSKHLSKSTGREISRLIVPELQQRKMELLIG